MFNTINCIFNYILLSFTTNSNFIRYVCSKRGDNLLKRYVLIFALILFTITAFAKPESGYRSKLLPNSKEKTESSVRADSIMKEVIRNAENTSTSCQNTKRRYTLKGARKYSNTTFCYASGIIFSLSTEKQRHDLRDGKSFKVQCSEQLPTQFPGSERE